VNAKVKILRGIHPNEDDNDPARCTERGSLQSGKTQRADFIGKGKVRPSTTFTTGQRNTAIENNEITVSPMRPLTVTTHLYPPPTTTKTSGQAKSRFFSRRSLRLPSQVLPPSLRRTHPWQTAASARRSQPRPADALFRGGDPPSCLRRNIPRLWGRPLLSRELQSLGDASQGGG